MSDYLYIYDLTAELEEFEWRLDPENDAQDPLDEEEQQRYEAIKQLDEEIDFSTFDRNHSDGLIPEDEWEQYAEELAYDIGMVDRDSTISNYIDWERWAEDLQMDYSTVEFEGTTYYFR